MTETETLAVLEALEALRTFILGYWVKVFCDQKAVLALMKKTHPSKFFRYRESRNIPTKNLLRPWLQK